VKVRTSEISVGQCFRHGRVVRKKVEDDKAVTRSVSGKVSTRKIKGDPEVEITQCPLNMLGVGLRRHPETVVQIGDSKPRRRK
jgi:hypothetical protein